MKLQPRAHNLFSWYLRSGSERTLALPASNLVPRAERYEGVPRQSHDQMPAPRRRSFHLRKSVLKCRLLCFGLIMTDYFPFAGLYAVGIIIELEPQPQYAFILLLLAIPFPLALALSGFLLGWIIYSLNGTSAS